MCSCFYFKWFETEIGSDIVGVMDQDVGECRSVAVFFGIVQHKMKGLWAILGPYNMGSYFN